MIAAVGGWCVGGALVVAMMCDLLVTADNGKFSYPAAKLGFTRAIVPAANRPKQPVEGIEIVGVKRIEEALEALRG